MNEAILIDTDVASTLFKGALRSGGYSRWIENRQVTICFASVAELYHWALSRRWGSRRIEQLKTMLEGFTVLSFDDDMAWHWATVMAGCNASGRPMLASDAWVAAAALRFDLPLLTGNIKDFEAATECTGLKLIIP